MPLIFDWGSGLESSLYEQAIVHFFGEEEHAVRRIPVAGSVGKIGDHRMKLVAPDVAFKVTGLLGRTAQFEYHATKLLQHTSLKAIHWANITQGCIVFRTLCSEFCKG